MRSATRKRIGKSPAYLEWLHHLPCCIMDHECGGAITAHHAGSRGLGQKAPDYTAVPLCDKHHNRMSHISVHSVGRNFWINHGIRIEELIKALNASYENSVRP